MERDYLTDIPDDKFNVKEVIVLWSGGCDSTVLLYYIAKRMQEMGIDTKDHLFTISYDFDYVSKLKQKYEKKAREDLTKVFKERFSIEFESIEMKITSNLEDMNNFFSERGGIHNKPSFTLQLLNTTYILALAHPKATIFDGFLGSDGFIYGKMFSSDFKKLLDAWNNISGKDLEFIQPLIQFKKSDIIKELMDLDLYRYIWFCESNNENLIKPCYNCHSCESHINGLIELVISDNNKTAKQILKDECGIIIERKEIDVYLRKDV